MGSLAFGQNSDKLSGMFIYFIKFIHLIFTLGLLGSTLYCLAIASSQRFATSKDSLALFNRLMLWFALFTILTGTLLVYPKHFTFHTPWIQAAYVLVFSFGTLMSLLLAFKKKRSIRGWWWSIYAVSLVLLLAVVHDAVTKTTFLF